MTHPSKNKGNTFERWAVNLARQSGVPAQRAYASNGESLGLHAEVDVVIGGYKCQCKRRKILASHIVPSEYVDLQLIKADYQDAMCVLPFTTFLDLVKAADVESSNTAAS